MLPWRGSNDLVPGYPAVRDGLREAPIQEGPGHHLGPAQVPTMALSRWILISGHRGKPVLGDSSGLVSILLWQLLRRWHISCSPLKQGKFRPSSEHIQQSLGMGTVEQSKQDPSPSDW